MLKVIASFALTKNPRFSNETLSPHFVAVWKAHRPLKFGVKTTLQTTCEDLPGRRLGLQCQWDTPKNGDTPVALSVCELLLIMQHQSLCISHAKAKVFHYFPSPIQKGLLPSGFFDHNSTRRRNNRRVAQAGSGGPHRFKSGMNKAAEQRTTLKSVQQQHWPPPDLFPRCLQLCIFPNYVALPQRDRRAMMSAETQTVKFWYYCMQHASGGKTPAGLGQYEWGKQQNLSAKVG